MTEDAAAGPPRPGIIPIRPLTSGEILRGSLAAMRRNPKAVLALSASLAVITGVLLGVGSDLAVLRSLSDLDLSMNSGASPRLERGEAVVGVLVGLCVVVSLFSSAVLTGLLSGTIGHAVLGRKEPAASAWRIARSRIGRVAATVVLAGVIVALGMAVALGVSEGLGFAIGIGARLVPLGVLAGGIFAVLVTVRWSVAVPVVVLEHAGPAEALARSWRLVRGHWWRVFWLLLLAQAIVVVVSG